MVCSTNDPGEGLYGVARQLLAIKLSHPVDGRPQQATPTLLGALPQVSGCGTAETEGIDIHVRRMLVVAHEPNLCHGWVDLFTYRLRHAAPRAPST
jgi:hypothetical protein